MGYEESLDYLYGLERLGVRLGLDNTLALLERLGNPHEAFPSIHVAGSKGKGSVCAFLDAILRKAGYRVGLYTSPHLVRFNERIRVDGEAISDDDVVRLAEAIRPHADGMRAQGEAHQPTFFEFTTALAFRYFEEHEVDIAVVEVGMGGRLDATNVLQPRVTVITHVEREHTQYLGRTIARIAGEKAGIIKEGVPLWTVEQEALEVVARRAQAVGAPLRIVGRDLRVKRGANGLDGQTFTLSDDADRTYRIPLLGTYQPENAALAFGALRSLQQDGWTVGRRAVRDGFGTTRWPARFEVVHHAPTIVVDSTHTPEGASRLRETLEEIYPGRKALVVLGVLEDKDPRHIAAALAPTARRFIVTQPDTERAFPARRAAEALGLPDAVVVTPVAKAIGTALEEATPAEVVVITGSLYTAGEALTFLDDWKRERTREVVRRLKQAYLPGEFETADLETALGRITRRTEDPFAVLISTVLSQRTADPTTDAVSAALFARFPTPGALATAPLEEIEVTIRPANFYRTKARAIQEIARRVVGQYGGNVPEEREELMQLPLVGRKTANCVLVYGYGKPAIPVDVHCHRIPNRIGLIHTKDERETEEALEALLPPSGWLEVNELFVRHGQTTCRPTTPACSECTLQDLCAYNLSLQALALEEPAEVTSAG
ncbi:MAG: glutamate ligase domain-containing protein [Thermoplasmata archaeon]